MDADPMPLSRSNRPGRKSGGACAQTTAGGTPALQTTAGGRPRSDDMADARSRRQRRTPLGPGPARSPAAPAAAGRQPQQRVGQGQQRAPVGIDRGRQPGDRAGHLLRGRLAVAAGNAAGNGGAPQGSRRSPGPRTAERPATNAPAPLRQQAAAGLGHARRRGDADRNHRSGGDRPPGRTMPAGAAQQRHGHVPPRVPALRPARRRDGMQPTITKATASGRRRCVRASNGRTAMPEVHLKVAKQRAGRRMRVGRPFQADADGLERPSYRRAAANVQRVRPRWPAGGTAVAAAYWSTSASCWPA